MTRAVVFAVIATLAGGALQFDRLVPFVTSHDIGFGSQSDGNVLSLEADDGDVQCWVHAEVVVPGEPDPVFAANIVGGEQLEVSQSRLETGGPKWALQVMKKGSAPNSCTQFKWPSGAKIQIAITSSRSARPELATWQVFREKGESDSSQKNKYRFVWHWLISLPLMIFGFVYGGIQLGKTKPPAVDLSTAFIFRTLATGVDGKSEDETKKIQKALELIYLGGESAETARATADLPGDVLRNARVVMRGRIRRLAAVVKDLEKGSGLA